MSLKLELHGTKAEQNNREAWGSLQRVEVMIPYVIQKRLYLYSWRLNNIQVKNFILVLYILMLENNIRNGKCQN